MSICIAPRLSGALSAVWEVMDPRLFPYLSSVSLRRSMVWCPGFEPSNTSVVPIRKPLFPPVSPVSFPDANTQIHGSL